MPAAKPVEARRQTQHKLETMARYWRTWGWILAHNTKSGFCSKHLWLVDTMAGAGHHESVGDKDGWIPGTPLQAVLAAKANQLAVPGVTFHVRAIDNDTAFVRDLEALVARHRGRAPGGVDVVTFGEDWRRVTDSISSEITAPCQLPGFTSHEHRSLWLIDPFGVEPLDWRLIERLPRHAEVIVNFDENTVRRFAGRAEADELLHGTYRDDRWKAGLGQPLGTYAQIFADQFVRWKHRTKHALWASGSQDRFLIHLTDAPQALRPFETSVKNGLKAGTLIAGDILTVQQQRAIVAGLAERFQGLTLSIDDMYAAGVGASKVQIRTLAQQAADDDYGIWNPKARSVTWFPERYNQPSLDL